MTRIKHLTRPPSGTASDGSGPAIEEATVVVEVEPDGTATVRTRWISIIKNKLRAAYARVKSLVRIGAVKTKDTSKTAAHNTAHVAKKTGKGFVWTVTGALSVFGRTGWHAGQLMVGALQALLTTAYILTMLTVELAHDVAADMIILSHRGIYFLTLLVCSPWIAFHSVDALKTDWKLFAYGLKPRNWNILRPSELAKKLADEEQAEAYLMHTAWQAQTGQHVSSAAPPEGQSPVSEPVTKTESPAQTAPGKGMTVTKGAGVGAGRNIGPVTA